MNMNAKSLEDTIHNRDNYVDKVTVLRLDGNNFSKLTKNMNKFDSHFTNSMFNAAVITADFIGARKFFTGSDEVSFLLDRANSVDGSLHFGGRKDKLLSLSAATMSMNFSREFGIDAIFDARLFTADTMEVWDTLLASRMSSVRRNAINTAGWVKFGTKQMLNVPTREKAKMLHDIDFVIPERELFGTLAEKIPVERELTEEERMNIPDKFRPPVGTLVTRNDWVTIQTT